MNEKEFIFSRLHYLNERVTSLTEILERQQELIGNLVGVIELMQSPEYASKQAKIAKMADVAEKIKFIRDLNKK